MIFYHSQSQTGKQNFPVFFKGIVGRGHFQTLLIATRRRTLHKDIGKYLKFQAATGIPGYKDFIY